MLLSYILKTEMLTLLFDLHHNAFGERPFGAHVTRDFHFVVMHAVSQNRRDV
jgi:hypothetical protein